MRLEQISALELILTAACNLRCSYCYQTNKNARSMQWPAMRAGLDLLLASTATNVSVLFIGGEPLLEFRLIERAVTYLDKMRRPNMRIRYTVITNGTLLGDEHAAFFASHDFELQISFDGVTDAQDLRGPGTFTDLDTLVDALRERNPDYFARRVRVSTTLTPQSIVWLADSIAYFCEKGIREVRVSPDFTTRDWCTERITELDRAFARVFDTVVTHYNRTGHIPIGLWRNTSTPARSASTGPICSVATGSKLTIDVDGNTVACVALAPSYQSYPTIFLRDRAEALQFGHVESAALSDTFATAPAAARASGLFHNKSGKHSSYGRCADCQYVSRCGYCPVSIGHQRENDDPNRVPDFICAFNLIVNKYRDLFPRMSATAQAMRTIAPAPSLAPDVARVLFGGRSS